MCCCVFNNLFAQLRRIFLFKELSEYSKNSVDDDRTFEGHPTIFHFSRAFQGHDAFQGVFKARVNHVKEKARHFFLLPRYLHIKIRTTKISKFEIFAPIEFIENVSSLEKALLSFPFFTHLPEITENRALHQIFLGEKSFLFSRFHICKEKRN